MTTGLCYKLPTMDALLHSLIYRSPYPPSSVLRVLRNNLGGYTRDWAKDKA